MKLDFKISNGIVLEKDGISLDVRNGYVLDFFDVDVTKKIAIVALKKDAKSEFSKEKDPNVVEFQFSDLNYFISKNENDTGTIINEISFTSSNRSNFHGTNMYESVLGEKDFVLMNQYSRYIRISAKDASLIIKN